MDYRSDQGLAAKRKEHGGERPCEQPAASQAEIDACKVASRGKTRLADAPWFQVLWFTAVMLGLPTLMAALALLI